MTALQEQAINMIKHAPDEEVTYVISILNRYALKKGGNKDDSLEKSRSAYRRLMSFCRKGSATEDYKRDLAEALDEKYESIS